MIARISIFLLLIIILPDVYAHACLPLKDKRRAALAKALWWLPGIAMTAYTIYLALIPSFAPDSISTLNVYLFLLGLLVIPKLLFTIISLIGLAVKKTLRTRTNYGNHIGLLAAASAAFIVIYGSTIGFRKINVNRIEVYSEELPESFDGYKIVQISDAHVGTYHAGNMHILEKAIDSINAQHPDAIVFTGDLQNREPSEILPVIDTFRRLSAKDGIFSVMGNHDYADYTNADAAGKARNEAATMQYERQMGWTLLTDEHRTIRRGSDSIVIAGMQNDGRPPFPSKGDIGKTLQGTTAGTFIVMLQHDPTSWRRTVLPHSTAQLTLSGHTHATQFMLFGWSPASLIYDEWAGTYQEGRRTLYVSTGLGGFIPFRFGVPGEVAVITLRKGTGHTVRTRTSR